MSTEIDGFKTTTDSLITTKTTPRSITPANVGGQINALADIVEAFRVNHVAGIGSAQAAADAAQEDVDVILALIGDGSDPDSVVNKLSEALAILSNFSEGADVAAMINNKVDKVTGKSLLADTEITRLLGLGNYTHPTGDGNLHVPATSTTNNGKFLMAGATAGALSWVALAISNISGLATALAGKQDTLVSGTNLRTVGTQSLLGSGNIDVPIKVAGVIDEDDLPLVDIMPIMSDQFESVGGIIYVKNSVLASGAGVDSFGKTKIVLWNFLAGSTSLPGKRSGSRYVIG